MLEPMFDCRTVVQEVNVSRTSNLRFRTINLSSMMNFRFQNAFKLAVILLVIYFSEFNLNVTSCIPWCIVFRCLIICSESYFSAFNLNVTSCILWCIVFRCLLLCSESMALVIILVTMVTTHKLSFPCARQHLSYYYLNSPFP